MTQPPSQQSDQSTVFVVDPDGWYGLLSLRPPSVFDSGTALGNASWLSWITRLTGAQVLSQVSCNNDVRCWIAKPGSLADPLTAFPAWVKDNDYVQAMLQGLSASAPARVEGSAVFTGFNWGNGEVSGLDGDQMATVASAYRMAQRTIITEMNAIPPPEGQV